MVEIIIISAATVIGSIFGIGILIASTIYLNNKR